MEKLFEDIKSGETITAIVDDGEVVIRNERDEELCSGSDIEEAIETYKDVYNSKLVSID